MKFGENSAFTAEITTKKIIVSAKNSGAETVLSGTNVERILNGRKNEMSHSRGRKRTVYS